MGRETPGSGESRFNEFTQRPDDVGTFIREDINGEDPGGTISTLDSIFVAVGGSVGVNRTIMTYYHGLESTPVVFSGFPLWYFQRQQQIILGDFVLQNIFGLQRQPLSRNAGSGSFAARRASQE